METQPYVQLYGGPVLASGSESTSFSPAQACLLALAYVEPNGSLTREKIAWLLWDEGEGEKQRHRIRQLVYATNERAGVQLLRRDGDTVLPLFAADTSEVAPSDLRPLARITSSPTAAFDHWLDGAIQQLEQSRTERLAEAADALLAKGQWADVFDIARRLCRFGVDPDQWAALLVRASIRSARTSAGRATLLNLRSRGAIGEEDLIGFLQTLQEASRIPITTEHRLPLIGRQAEIEWIRRQIGGSPGLRFLGLIGEGGVGKTRLLEEAALIASSEGRHVSLCRLREGKASAPLAGLRDILWHMVPESICRALAEPWCSIVSALMGNRQAGLEALDPLSNRHRVSQAVGLALAKATLERPSVLLVDDLHHVDATSLEILTALASGWRGGPLTVAVAIRTDLSQTPAPAIAALLAEATVEYLRLKGLSHDACDALLETTGLGGLPRSDCEELISLSSGNPLLLIDLARSWDRRGGAILSAVPQSIQELTRIRLNGIDGFDKQVLALIAAWPGVDSSQLMPVLGQASWKVIDSLERLVTAGLVELSEGGYGFRHALLREAVAAELGAIRAKEAHLRVARYLVQEDVSRPEELVQHFYRGGASEEAARWALVAAERARDAGALPEALEFLEIALEAPSRANDADLLGAAGQISLQLCQLERGVGLLSRAEGGCGDIRRLEWAVARLDALSESGKESHSSIAKALEDVAEEAREGSAWEVSLMATETAIRVLERAGDWNRIGTLIAAVRRRPEPAELEARIRQNMVLALGVVYCDVEGALAAATRAFELGTETRPGSLLTAKAAHRLFVVLLSLGRVQTAVGRACLEALRVRALKTGDLRLQYTSLANQAVWHLDTGELEAAQGKLSDAERIVRGTTAQNELQNLATNWGDLLLRQNRPTQALRHFERAQALIQDGTRRFLRDLVRAGMGLSKLRLGQLKDAEEARAHLDWYEHYYFDPSLIIRLHTETLWRRGRRDEAIALLGTERSRIRNRFVPQYLTLTLWEGRLRMRLGQGGAAALAEEVATRADQLGISQLATRALTLKSDWC